MNILILSEYFPESDRAEITGGVENRAFNLARHLAKKHNVYVMTSRRPGQGKEATFSGIRVLRHGFSYEYTSTGSILKRGLWCLGAILRIPWLMIKNKIAIVDGQSFFCYPAAIFSKLLGAGAHITYQETWMNNWVKNTGKKAGILGEIMERKILFLSRLLKIKVISVSNTTKRELMKYGLDSVVVPNGINTGYYGTIKAKKTKTPSICYIGRLVEHKRVDDLLRAVSEIKKNIPDVKCRIIGDGPERKKLVSLSRKLGVEKNVVFLGYVKKCRDAIKTLKSSWVLCHPGTVEGFGIVLLESMASRVPYVASDIDVFREVTGNGKGGLHFRASNYKSLAEKVMMLINDKKLYDKKITEAKFVEKYDWKKISDGIERVYAK